jgi:hypothetical protein
VAWDKTPEGSNVSVREVLAQKQELLKWLRANIKIEAYQPAES